MDLPGISGRAGLMSSRSGCGRCACPVPSALPPHPTFCHPRKHSSIEVRGPAIGRARQLSRLDTRPGGRHLWRRGDRIRVSAGTAARTTDPSSFAHDADWSIASGRRHARPVPDYRPASPRGDRRARLLGSVPRRRAGVGRHRGVNVDLAAVLLALARENAELRGQLASAQGMLIKDAID